MNTMLRSLLVAVALVLALPVSVQAGGLYLLDRGSRPLSRGGAFVAGADDGHSLWYNPAGLAYVKGTHILADGTLTFFRGSFERVTRDDVNGPSPKVSMDPLLLPIPTLALVSDLGLEDFSFGLGLIAPNAVTHRWPESVGTTADGLPGPSPTRHSLISQSGSVIAMLAAGVAYRGIPGLSLGAGVHVVGSRFRAGSYLSACDYGALCQQSEQADYEAPALIDLNLAITAYPMLGLIYEWEMLKIGASVMFPYNIQGKAKLDAELPSAPLFGPSDGCATDAQRASNPDCARIVGDKADVKLPMPLIARFGVELRPTDAWRMEGAVVYEGWSRQREFSIEPHGIRIENALGIPTYDVGPMSIRRDMQDVWSLRFGVEWASSAPLLPITLRAGVLLENSAFANRTLTPLTLDSKKAMVAVGWTYRLTERLAADVMYAHVFMANPKVRNSEVYPQNPLRPPLEPSASDPVGTPEPIGNGNYALEADVIGAALRLDL